MWSRSWPVFDVSALGNASFWLDTLERAVRSFAQGVLTASGIGLASVVTPDAVLQSLGVVIPSIPWQADLLFGAANSLLSVLTSLSSLRVPGADHETGSFLA